MKLKYFLSVLLLTINCFSFSHATTFNNYFELIENVHIKDRTFRGPTVPLGEGDAKVANVLKELKFRGYDKNLILQAARIPNMDDVELMTKYKKFVDIGSYPFFRLGKIGVAIVTRSTSIPKLKKVSKELIKLAKIKNIKILKL